MSEARKLEFNESQNQIVSLDDLYKLVLIEDLKVDNKELFSNLTKLDSNDLRVNEVKKTLEIGAFVKTKVQMVMDTDYIDLKVKSMTDNFSDGVDNVKDKILSLVDTNFDPAKTGSYTNKINEFFDQKKEEFIKIVQNSLNQVADVKKRLDDNFNPEMTTSHLHKVIEAVSNFEKEIEQKFDMKIDGSISNQLQKMISDNFGSDGVLMKAIEKKLSFDNPESTVQLLQSNILKEIRELKDQLLSAKSASEAEEAAAQKSIQKGYDFEDLLFEKLEEFASINGDIVEDVSKVAGDVSRSKKGDFNYKIKSLNKTIAIEAKNRKAPATPTSLISSMDETKTNRKADYVIHFAENESQLHKQIGLFQEYDNDKLVTHFGLWEIAIKVAISRVRLENAEIEGIDRLAYEQEINNIFASLKTFKSIKTSVNNILKEANKITAQSDQINNEISSAINSLNNLIQDKTA